MKIIRPFSLLLLVMIASCRKDPRPVPHPSPINKVSRISSVTEGYQAFQYNTHGLLSSYTAAWKTAPGTTTKITHTMVYDGNKLVKTTNNVGYTLFTYQNNLPQKAENFFFNDKPLSTLFFHFDAQNKLDHVIEQMAFPKPDDVEATKISYQYYATGNVSRVDFAYRLPSTGNFVIQLSKLFEQYDNKMNPEPGEVLGIFINGIILNKNNPLKITNLDANGNQLGYSRFEYNYNPAGYPVQRKHFIAVGTQEQSPILFQYTY